MYCPEQKNGDVRSISERELIVIGMAGSAETTNRTCDASLYYFDASKSSFSVDDSNFRTVRRYCSADNVQYSMIISTSLVALSFALAVPLDMVNCQHFQIGLKVEISI